MSPSFKSIPQFPITNYKVNVSWSDLERQIYNRRNPPHLILEPDYQRGHVWSEEQQIAYVEYGLMGGESSMQIRTNCPGWMADFRGPYELMDGLQRVTAVLRFLRNEIPAFGYKHSEYSDKMNMIRPAFEWQVYNLPTRVEILNLYLLINSGGVVHSKEEIARVKALLETEKQNG